MLWMGVLRDPKCRELVRAWSDGLGNSWGVLRDPECMHLVWAWSSGKLPRVTLGDVFPGIEACSEVSVRKPEARTISASLDLQELIHVLSVVKHTHAKRILEIGTFDGFTALNLAAALDDDGDVCTVDLSPDSEARAQVANACNPEVVGAKFRGEKEATKIRQLWADSRKTDWGEFGAPFDLILIDGCHDYPYVKNDSINAIKHTQAGGTVLWHDYGHYRGVSKALDELAQDHRIVTIRGTRIACYRKSS
jgi:predicted O-methyltransferase YrrM